jgi:hypothetical protein
MRDIVRCWTTDAAKAGTQDPVVTSA